MTLTQRIKTLWALSEIAHIEKGNVSFSNPAILKSNKKQMAQIVSRKDPLADIIEK